MGVMFCVSIVLHSFDNSKCGVFVYRIYPIELEIKNITDTARSALYLDLHLRIDNRCRKTDTLR